MKFAKDFRMEALNALNNRWGLAIGVGLIASILGGGIPSGISSYISNSASRSSQTYSTSPYINHNYGIAGLTIGLTLILIAIMLVFYVIAAAVSLGYICFNLKMLRPGGQPTVNDIFSRFRILWKAVALNLIIGIFTFLWSLLFLIPGIYAAYGYSMAPYLLAENPDMSAREAIRLSKEMMNGNRWRLFCLEISFIGWGLLSVLTCGIGFLFLSPYMALARAAFYNEVSGNNIRSEEMTANAVNMNEGNYYGN